MSVRTLRRGARELGDSNGRVDPTVDAINSANASRLPRALDAIARSLSPAAQTDRVLRSRAQTWASVLLRRAQRRRPRLDVFGFGDESQHAADLAVAAQAVQGDAHAIDAVRLRVQAIVLSRIYCMGLGRHEDELLESIMDRIWDKLPSYRGQASLPTWAWTVASNYLRNWQRDVGARYARTLRIDAYAGTGNSIAAPAEDAPSYSVEETERQEHGRRLMARIAKVASQQLQPDEWELIQRVIVRGEGYATIATEQSERPGTLRARVFRALERLRGPLRQELDDEAGEYLREA